MKKKKKKKKRVELLPVMVVWCEHHAGTGVSVAGDPRAVHSEHHQQHQHEHGHYGLNVWPQTLLCLLLLWHMFAYLSSLQGETKSSLITEIWIIQLSKLLNELIEGNISRHPHFWYAVWTLHWGMWYVILHQQIIDTALLWRNCAHYHLQFTSSNT